MQLDALSQFDFHLDRPHVHVETMPASQCHQCARELDRTQCRRQWLHDATAEAPICLNCHHDRRRQAALERRLPDEIACAVPTAVDVREEVTLAVAMAGLTLGWTLAGPPGGLVGLGLGVLAGRFAHRQARRNWQPS